ncbi:MAG: hypothetical protein GHCLOJNM_02788 [bacterium]|nr:hypothetical protein [bacterium]
MSALSSLLVQSAGAHEYPSMPLWPSGAPQAMGTEEADVPTLTPFLPDSSMATGAAVVVCPGGGYSGLAEHEGRDIARWLNSLGIAGFVLKYRHSPRYGHPAPLQDAARAVRTVRARGSEWGVDPARIGIMGFSAGGHLASTLGTHFDSGNPTDEDPIERAGSRPDLLILCYPVISMGDLGHKGSRKNLLGENPSEELVELLSNEKQVTPRTPPTFLFHTADDGGVDAGNSLAFAEALRKAGVPYELHVFQQGRHGVGLALNDPILSAWPARLEDWLTLQKFLPARTAPPTPLEPVPTARQLAWQEAELVMFLHFGMNTFTNREWGEGTEDPKQFNPTRLDARQWAREAKHAGFKWVILTAKHHDGFCLWPSAHTEHSVRNSPWLEGKGDVVAELAEACREEGLRLGLYLSPWDRHEPRYNDSPAYDEYFKAQLTELLSNYGPISEVWFDGAGSEGHVYDFPGYYALIRRLQPDAVIAICGPDVRWVGNEDGVARETEWSVQPANPSFHGAGSSKVWYPAECDTSIRPGWFWHADQDDKVKSLGTLMDVYYKSVGRNSLLLLNVPPNNEGLLPAPDVARLREFRAALEAIFSLDFALGKPCTASNSRGGDRAYHPGNATDTSAGSYWATDDSVTEASLEVDLGSPKTFNVARLEEMISLGQRVEKYRLEARVDGEWKKITEGTTIGRKKLDRFETVAADKVRLVIEKSLACPTIRSLGLHLDSGRR